MAEWKLLKKIFLVRSIYPLFFVVCLSLVLSQVFAQPLATQVTQCNFHGWDDSVKLNNGYAQVIVTPSIGRITHFSLYAEENLLHIDPRFAGKRLIDTPIEKDGKPIWATFGGDRIWPMEESLFEKVNGSKRPPDYDIDGLPWQVEMLKEGVAITSRVSRFNGVKIRREIRLKAGLASVLITQKMTKVKAAEPADLAPLPMTIWNITKVHKPDVIFFPLYDDVSAKQDQASVIIPEWEDVPNQAAKNLVVEDGIAYLYPGEGEHQKLGGRADGWIAMIKKDRLFVELFTFIEKATYPDGGTSATTWMGEGTAELECLSPLVSLKPGESIRHNLEWFACVLKEDSLQDRIEEALQIMSVVTYVGPGIITY